MTFVDVTGKPIKRLIIDAFESHFRKGYVLSHLELSRGLPQLFTECFDNYCKMQKSERWRPLSHICKSILDPAFMEYKCSQLMAGLERLLRNSLIDKGLKTEKEAEKVMLLELVATARNKLGWDIPKHYTANDRVRLLRNAVAHGGSLPWPSDEVTRDLQKWTLFLMRRVLLHLGFTGPVKSPDYQARLWTESKVDDFSESHNSFGP